MLGALALGARLCACWRWARARRERARSLLFGGPLGELLGPALGEELVGEELVLDPSGVLEAEGRKGSHEVVLLFPLGFAAYGALVILAILVLALRASVSSTPRSISSLMVPDITDGNFNAGIKMLRSDKVAWFGPPRKDQSTASRRAAHLEHTNTPRAPFSVRAAVRNIFR